MVPLSSRAVPNVSPLPMSQPYNWPLSLTANKSNGSCSVCLTVHQLHLRYGTIHLHGPRDKKCPGSHKPHPGNSGRIVPDTAVSVAADSVQGSGHVKPLISDTNTDVNIIIHHTLYVPSDTSQRVRGPPVQQR